MPSTSDNVRSLKGAAAYEGASLRETANEAGHRVRQFIDNAGEEISHASEVVTKQIKERPVQSTLVALGAGVLLGLLMRR